MSSEPLSLRRRPAGNTPRSSVLDQARGRGKWEESAGPTGDHWDTPLLRYLPGQQRGVWREGLRTANQPGLLEGGLARRAPRGSTCGSLLPDPREREVPRARLSQLLGARSSAHSAPSVKELSVQRQHPHHGPRPFAGDQCPKSFTQPATLASHHWAHAAERTYTCPESGKTFVHQSTLTHYHTHTGEKPCECAECAKRSGRLSTLLEHRRTHRGEWPFQCTPCGCCFGRLSTLREHPHMRTGEKPFQ
ncbi:Zinc finger protein 510 [Plecturocebus cupreus]